MKIIIWLALFLLVATVIKAQDELIATKYSIDEKSFQTFKHLLSIILDECRIVKSNVDKNVLIEVSKLILAEAGKRHIQHELSMILCSNKSTLVSFKFSFSSIKNNNIFKTYTGEI